MRNDNKWHRRASGIYERQLPDGLRYVKVVMQEKWHFTRRWHVQPSWVSARDLRASHNYRFPTWAEARKAADLLIDGLEN